MQKLTMLEIKQYINIKVNITHQYGANDLLCANKHTVSVCDSVP